MPSPDDVQYAMETTRVLMTPDRRIDTFGDTRFDFLLLSELMDEAGRIRIRSGNIEAVRPRLIRPDAYRDLEFEGFDEQARERIDRMIEKMRQSGQDMAFLNYGFRFARGKVTEELLSDSIDNVRERLLGRAREEGNPAQAVIEGVDDAWEVSVVKFTFDMILASLPINQFDLKRRGLL
jgi:hypothetical protein